MPLDFASGSLPWLDQQAPDIDGYLKSLKQPPANLRAQLEHWSQFGFIRMPALVDHALIDAYLEDVDAVLAHPERTRVHLTIEGFGERPACEFPRAAFEQHHLRFMDLHNLSQAGKALSLHPGIVEFLGHVLRDTVVAMQSLTFQHSTEQRTHQDFAYVRAQIPSHLAATWIALEDVHPDSGPLFYYPASHRIDKFDWGNGLFLTPESTKSEDEFATFLDAKCADSGLQREVFYPKKGDVFFWHAALAHGGSQVINPTLTRKSYVTHYSSKTAYPRDRRAPHKAPVAYKLNGGEVFQDPTLRQEENRLPFPRPVDGKPQLGSLPGPTKWDRLRQLIRPD
jgi:phytanoyl-CoA hydroxylase